MHRTLLITALLVLVTVAASASGSDRNRQEQQAKLDQACESARQEKLIPERKALVEQCVKEGKPRPDRASCERFYSDHGNQSGSRAPLYMDLPQCVEAHEFRQGGR